VECFEKTFVGLEHCSPQALKLLSLLAFLDSQSLHADILEHRNLTSNSSLRDLDAVQLKIAAGVLKDFKLLKTNESSKTSSIHDLAQELFHDWLPQEKRKMFLLEAIDFMWLKYPHRDVVHKEDMWKQASLYLSHTLKVIGHCEKYGVENQKVFDLWIRAARTLAEKDFGEQAKKLASHACAYSHVDNLQASPSEQIEALTAYGYIIHYGGNYKDAGPFYQKALEIARSKLGGSHKQTLTSLNNWGDIIYKHGDIDGAIRAWKEVIATGRKVSQDSEEGVHPYGSMVNLSEAYRRKGDAEALLEAENLLREAMRELRRRQGEKSSWTLVATAELGMTLLCQIGLGTRHATQEAENLLERAYRGLSEVLGPEDQYTCRARDALAELWKLDVD
jgi:tetratricopeptide (TPR) repeat protein